MSTRVVALLWLVLGAAVWNGFFDLYVSTGRARIRAAPGRARTGPRARPGHDRRDGAGAARRRPCVDGVGVGGRLSAAGRASGCRCGARPQLRGVPDRAMHPLIHDWNAIDAPVQAAARHARRRDAARRPAVAVGPHAGHRPEDPNPASHRPAGHRHRGHRPARRRAARRARRRAAGAGDRRRAAVGPRQLRRPHRAGRHCCPSPRSRSAPAWRSKPAPS